MSLAFLSRHIKPTPRPRATTTNIAIAAFIFLFEHAGRTCCWQACIRILLKRQPSLDWLHGITEIGAGHDVAQRNALSAGTVASLYFRASVSPDAFGFFAE